MNKLNIDQAIRKIKFKKKTKRGLSYIYYKDYINSEYWELKRQEKLSLKPFCESCGVVAECVHHETYHRLGKENMKDLRSLCNQCHYDLHFIYNKSKNNKENLLRAFMKLRSSKRLPADIEKSRKAL